MEIAVEQSGDVTVVVLRGEQLDTSNAETFNGEIAPVLAAHSHVLFDLSHLQFVDSAGLGALMACRRQLNEAGGGLKLCGISKTVRTVFQISRMHRLFDISDTREEAISAFQQ